MPLTNAEHDELCEIYEDMQTYVRRIDQLLSKSGNSLVCEQAKGYWLAQMKMALSAHGHSYVSHNPFTMESALEAIDPRNDEEDDDFEAEEDACNDGSVLDEG